MEKKKYYKWIIKISVLLIFIILSCYEMDVIHKLTVIAGDNGTTDPSGTQEVYSDTPITISAIPDTAYEFYNWEVLSGSGCNIADENSANTTVTLTSEAVIIQANFVPEYPIVIDSYPSPNMNNVPVDIAIEITFSREMEITTTNDSIMIITNEEVISGTITWSNNNQTLIFTPEEHLLPSMEYTIIIDTTAQDIYGIHLENTLSLSFSTISKKDYAIQKGLAYLLADDSGYGQLSNGSWSDNVAVTSFVTLSLINAGYTYDENSTIKGDEAVTRGIDYIYANIDGLDGSINFEDNDYGFLELALIQGTNYNVYDNSSMIMPLAALCNKDIPESKKNLFLDAIEKLRNTLICLQNDNLSLFPDTPVEWDGGFGYGAINSRPDNSNTQFAIMGIYTANETLKLHNPPKALDLQNTYNKCAKVWLETTKLVTGGHSYIPGFISSHIICNTAAALWTYALCGYNASEDSSDISVIGAKADLSYIEEWYDTNSSFIYSYKGYFYFTLSKALLLNGVTTLQTTTKGEVNWYEKLCNFLIEGKNHNDDDVDEGQGEDGSWPPTWPSPDPQGYLETAWCIEVLQFSSIDGDDLLSAFFF